METSGSTKGLEARRAAWRLVNGVVIERKLLSEQAEAADLSPSDRARAQRLATTTLRWAQRVDRMLGPYLRKRPPEETLNLLRIAVIELCLDHAAPHGVVDAAVTLARELPETRRQAGLVNAVLRKIAGHVEAWEGLPLPSLPKWLRKALREAWGKAAVEAMEAAHAAGAPLDLTPRDGDASSLAAAVSGTVLPTGSVRLREATRVSGLPGYDEGLWWVQDAAAALPAKILAPRVGEAIADLCAAPGGKTMQLAAAGAHVTAIDNSERRLERVHENLSRTGLTATVVTADALTWEGGPFDAVLVDAPCSATGTIRRHPDLPFAKDEGILTELTAIQAALIDRAWTLLKPGGRMVFCTCSLLTAEGEDQVAAALARHPEMTLDTEACAVAGVEPEWIGDHGLRLRPDYWPTLGGMDGFFISCLRKPG